MYSKTVILPLFNIYFACINKLCSSVRILSQVQALHSPDVPCCPSVDLFPFWLFFLECGWLEFYSFPDEFGLGPYTKALILPYFSWKCFAWSILGLDLPFSQMHHIISGFWFQWEEQLNWNDVEINTFPPCRNVDSVNRLRFLQTSFLH